MVSSQYYREVVLMQKDIKEFLDYLTYQQDSAHARWSICSSATPDFMPPSLWPPNSPDLNPVVYKIWAAAELQPENLKRGRIVTKGNTWTSLWWQHVTIQAVVSTYLLLCGCKEQTLQANV